jgi:ribosomal protein L11 methylase PrmA
MKYKELIVKVRRNESETVQALLLEAGFDSMQIDDPMDAVDIVEHRELYKYDYINE